MVYLNDKPYGGGFDTGPRVKGDPEFCRLLGMVENGKPLNDCHLEGWPKRAECEMELMHGCPIWQFSVDGGKTVEVCHDDQRDGWASCDHFGGTVYRDDPKTPTRGDTLAELTGFEGVPRECGLQRDALGPNAGFFAIAHGGPKGCTKEKGPYWHVRACKPDGTGCGPWRPFCK